ncbi:hypothetical protein AVEN_31025-1 [Araneus ventricosus]|uniref:Uncharacterized protein n=1 Tax=Araneus ventricosus TaxID=182803 RepID=A0A4Y2LWP7_ARAVE|nr:hypothetical protein AVEN_31025-1 [Araneus ventricosus]
MPNAEYVDYEDEETDCSSDISELNHHKCDLASHQLLWLATGVTSRTGLWLQLLQVFLHDVDLITSNNSDLVVDENKLRREKAKVRKDLKFQALSEAQALTLKGLYFDGCKDSTLIEEKVDTKRYTRKAKKERLYLIEELGSRYITHLSPSFGTPKQISATIIGYFERMTRFSQLLAIGCDGTSVNTGWKSGVIRRLELKLCKPLQWVICLPHFNEHLL